MENTEKRKFFIKKIILALLFAAFWVLNFIHILRLDNGRETAIGLLYVMLFLPVTFTILLDYEVFSLFIIILYEIAMLLMGIIILSMGLAAKELGWIDIAGFAAQILFAAFLIASAIQYLRNKTHTLKIITLIIGIAHLTFVIISFITNGVFDFDNFYDFFRNVLIILIFSIYILTFPYIQLKIFKDEK